MSGAWFSALGEPLDEAEKSELAAYLTGLSMDPAMPLRRARLERKARLDPADQDWLALNEALHGAAAGAASYAAYQARLAQAARAPAAHPFLRKYALYCGGSWVLGIYDHCFAIF